MQPASDTLLITGAAGFLGYQAVEKALAQGKQVVAVVRPRGEDGRSGSQPLAQLQMKYPGRLKIETVNFEDMPSIAALIARHPEIDSVLHAAALVRPRPGEEESVQRLNVEATIALTNACQALAEQKQTPIRFHFTSSISALYYEKQATPQHNHAVAAEAYGKSKCDASRWLNDHAHELTGLDVRITYPPAIIGAVPSSAWISHVLRMGYAKDKGFSKVKADKPESITRMVNCDHYLSNIFACFDAALAPGVHEYSVQPDYQVQVGELLRVAKDVVCDKKNGTPSHLRDVGEQVEMDFTLRQLPTVEEALGGKPAVPVPLYELLAAQYDVIAKTAKQRT